MKNLITKIALVAIAFAAFSCSSDNGNKAVGKKSITQLAIATPEMDSLVVALELTNLASKFDESGDYTVFAPTNDAFVNLLASLGKPSLAKLETDAPGTLANVLSYHVLNSRVLSTTLTTNQEVTTLLGQNFKVTIEDNTDPATYYFYKNIITLKNLDASINTFSSTVIARDVECSNGIIHPIDNVMLPAPASN